MKLYVGSRNYKPEGYFTVDIDVSMKPDIVADIRDMSVVSSATVDEVVAGHVLEHIDWPDNYLAITEFARILRIGGVLKIAVPDMSALMRMLMSGSNVFHVVGLIYGVGGRTNRWEQHRYGFTPEMLIDILDVLGFGEYKWWNSDFGDASNGWVPKAENRNAGMSLNIQAVKVKDAAVDARRLYEKLIEKPMSDFTSVAAELLSESGFIESSNASPHLYQNIHFQLIEARERIKYLEKLISK